MAGPFEIEVASAVSRRFDRLIVALGEGEPLPPAATLVPTVSRLSETTRFVGGEGKRVESPAEDGRGTVEIRSLGKTDAMEAPEMSSSLGRALHEGLAAGAGRIVLVLGESASAVGAPVASRLLREWALGRYRFDRYRSEGRTEQSKQPRLVVVPVAGHLPAWRSAATSAAPLTAAVARARDLGNAPPNEATPEWMAARSKEVGRRIGAKVTVLGPAELARRQMGGILAVGSGSAQPPRMVRLEWGRGPITVALVGKGVTFDSGGLSIKPAAAMDEMKWDKCGACAVLGALEAVASLELPIRVRAYLPFAENMLGAAAYRPGDIVRCANGKSVEILNTDAEGRLLLADALSWAASDGADSLLELSTLTGACVVALGQTAAGLFSPNDEISSELQEAARVAGERVWRLPIWPESAEEMKGSHADLRNSAGRWGGASNAAAFLAEFVSPIERWAHLDIAGPAYVGGEDRVRRGATGFGVALTVEWLSRLATDRPGRRSRAPG